MQYFSTKEFRQWAPLMSPRLLTMLDILRFKVNAGISISGSKEALGRKLGLESLSQHNIDKWGEVRAVDCFIEGVYTRQQVQEVVRKAIGIGMTGIGIYPDKTNNKGEKQVMFHFDVRDNVKMGDSVMWGQVGADYVSVDQAINKLPPGV